MPPLRTSRNWAPHFPALLNKKQALGGRCDCSGRPFFFALHRLRRDTDELASLGRLQDKAVYTVRLVPPLTRRTISVRMTAPTTATRIV